MRRLVSILVLMAAGPVAAGETITIVTPVNTIDTVISEVILRKAYKRIGITAEIRKYPAERALQLADRGKVDGEVQRIDGLSRKYKNLIQVYPPINFIAASAFTKDPTVKVNGWAGLRPYRVGIVRGIKFAENNTKGLKNLFRVGDYPNLIKILQGGRVDVIAAPAVAGRYQMAQMGVTGVRVLTPPLQRFELYHYLHKKNQALVPRITMALKDMEAKGELAALRGHVIKVLLDQASRGEPLCDDDYKCFD